MMLTIQPLIGPVPGEWKYLTLNWGLSLPLSPDEITVEDGTSFGNDERQTGTPGHVTQSKHTGLKHT